MTDLLTHVLFAYTLLRPISWRYEWFNSTIVTIGLVGAVIPDMAKIQLILPSSVISATLSIPFSWRPLTTIGGVGFVIAVATYCVVPSLRQRVAVVLSLGAMTHLFLDALLETPSGFGSPLFWPLSYARIPTGGLFLSTDPFPTIASLILALTVFGLSRRYK